MSLVHELRAWLARGSVRALLWPVLAAAAPAAAASFPLAAEQDAVVGTVAVVPARAEDTLLDIARRHGLGYEEIRHANPDADVWLPGAGTRVVLPTRFLLPPGPREGIVINLAELRLYYYPPARRGAPRRVVTHPISVGREGWEIPRTVTRIVAKATDPAWYPPASIRAEHAARGDFLPPRIPPGPDNPLGRHSLRLGLTSYLLHGTNQPYGIGMRVTHGCVRLYPEDIAALYAEVPVGTAVRIVDLPVKVGWHRGVLYLESHPPYADADAGAPEDPDPPPDVTGTVREIVAITPSERIHLVQWERVTAALEAQQGVPVPVSWRAAR